MIASLSDELQTLKH